MFARLVTFFHPNRALPFLVAYRWASLLPALLTLNADGQSGQSISPILVFAVAFVVNLFIYLTNHRLNKLVIDHPSLLSMDLLFTASMLAVSGGSHSPYYLYALSPLLAGAFFFQLRGALIVSAIYTPLYLLGNYFQPLQSPDEVVLVTQLAGIWLIPILFAYPSILLKDISEAREELSIARDELVQKHENLETAHRQLEIIHDLTVILQAAPDLISVQERVLGAVTTGLGFSKAVVALVDPAREELGGWLVYPAEETFPVMQPVALKSENGEVFKALINRHIFTTNHQTLVRNADLDHWLHQNEWFVLPLYLREHPVGLLMVDTSDGLSQERENTPRDIHDTVAQSLFGIVYSLDACINMLPLQADEVKKELIELRSLASGAHDEVRRSIFDLWPSALTIELFMADLTNYVGSCCRPHSFSIVFNNNGDFNSLPAGMRRTVYRMAQEALANSARHSGASSARLCLNITEDQIHLSITDEGRGFDPSIALSRSLNREHFGLQGIQERARAMGGDCEIISKLDAGTRIMIEFPINGHHA